MIAWIAEFLRRPGSSQSQDVIGRAGGPKPARPRALLVLDQVEPNSTEAVGALATDPLGYGVEEGVLVMDGQLALHVRHGPPVQLPGLAAAAVEGADPPIFPVVVVEVVDCGAWQFALEPGTVDFPARNAVMTLLPDRDRSLPLLGEKHVHLAALVVPARRGIDSRANAHLEAIALASLDGDGRQGAQSRDAVCELGTAAVEGGAQIVDVTVADHGDHATNISLEEPRTQGTMSIEDSREKVGVGETLVLDEIMERDPIDFANCLESFIPNNINGALSINFRHITHLMA